MASQISVDWAKRWRSSLLALLLVPAVLLISPQAALAQNEPAINLDNVYRDESHCLVDPEIRGAADKPISCYCRDAVADASYVLRTYLDTGKDRNLNGVHVALVIQAQRICGDDYDVLSAERSQWNGPEVKRTYPADSAIEKIPPDSNGFRMVSYEVQLTYRDQRGRTAKVERFRAQEKLPPNFKSVTCPPAAVCPK
jgi:hypothetical protein